MAMEPARGALQPGLVVDDPVVHRRTVNCDIGSFRGRYNPCGNGLYEKAEPGLGGLVEMCFVRREVVFGPA